MMKINEYTPIGKIAVIGNFLYTEMTQRKGSSVTTAPFPPDFNIDKQCELIYHIWNNCYSIMKEGKKELILISNGCDVTYIERSFKNFSAIIKTRYRQTVIKGFETINLNKLFEFIKSKDIYSFRKQLSIFQKKEELIIDTNKQELILKTKFVYNFKHSCIPQKVYWEITNAINKHWQGHLIHILDHAIASRYTSDRKNVWMLIMANSNFGKNKIFNWMGGWQGSAYVKFNDMIGTGITNKPPSYFEGKICLVIDEVLHFHRKLFEIEDTLEVRPMREHSVDVEIYGRYMISADGGSFNSDFIEKQIQNRVCVLDLRGTKEELGNNPVVKKYGQHTVKIVMEHYLYMEFLTRINRYEAMEETARINLADKTLEKIFNKYKIDKPDFFNVVKDRIYEIVSNPYETLHNSKDYRLFADNILTIRNKNKDGFLIKNSNKILKPMLEYFDPELERELRYKSVKQIEQETGYLNKPVRLNGETHRAIYIPRRVENIKIGGKEIEIVYENNNI